MAERKEFMVEDANIVFRNFSGKEDMYNALGNRNFSVILDEDVAADMAADGWNIKRLKAREEDDNELGNPYIEVTVGYKVRPPLVVMITSRARTHLGQDSIEVLDWADIETVDLIATGYEWSVGDKSGVKAYLKSMFVTIKEDALERKYAMLADEVSETPGVEG